MPRYQGSLVAKCNRKGQSLHSGWHGGMVRGVAATPFPNGHFKKCSNFIALKRNEKKSW